MNVFSRKSRAARKIWVAACPYPTGSLPLGHRPLDLKLWTIPKQTPVVLRRVIVRHFIDHLGVGLQGGETVRKALGNQELIPFFRTQDDAHVPAKGRRASPQVDRNIENSAPHHSN